MQIFRFIPRRGSQMTRDFSHKGIIGLEIEWRSLIEKWMLVSAEILLSDFFIDFIQFLMWLYIFKATQNVRKKCCINEYNTRPLYSRKSGSFVYTLLNAGYVSPSVYWFLLQQLWCYLHTKYKIYILNIPSLIVGNGWFCTVSSTSSIPSSNG